MTRTEAERLVNEWQADARHQPACDLYRPGRFDLHLGEHRCVRCQVPESVHRAYRMMVVTHG